MADTVARGFGRARRHIEGAAADSPYTTMAVAPMVGAGAGVGVGYGLGRLVDWYRMRDSALPRVLAAALGLGGATLGGYGAWSRMKSSHIKYAAPFGVSFGGVRDATHDIVMRIRQDPELTPPQKQSLLSVVNNLSPDAVQRLRQIISGLTGAALLAAVMRLAGGGRASMLGGAVAGGLAGVSLAGGPERTAHGLRPQRSNIF